MFNQKKFAEDISELLQQNKNIILIGPQDSGKTWFVQHTLIPYLQKQEVRVLYCENCDELPCDTQPNDIVIVDEVELLQDKDFLQTLYPDDIPYYTSEYLEKVSLWQKKLAKLTALGLFIVTREKEAISYLLKHSYSLEWNTTPCEMIEFNRRV